MSQEAAEDIAAAPPASAAAVDPKERAKEWFQWGREDQQLPEPEQEEEEENSVVASTHDEDPVPGPANVSPPTSPATKPSIDNSTAPPVQQTDAPAPEADGGVVSSLLLCDSFTHLCGPSKLPAVTATPSIVTPMGPGDGGALADSSDDEDEAAAVAATKELEEHEDVPPPVQLENVKSEDTTDFTDLKHRLLRSDFENQKSALLQKHTGASFDCDSDVEPPKSPTTAKDPAPVDLGMEDTTTTSPVVEVPSDEIPEQRSLVEGDVEDRVKNVVVKSLDSLRNIQAADPESCTPLDVTLVESRDLHVDQPPSIADIPDSVRNTEVTSNVEEPATQLPDVDRSVTIAGGDSFSCDLPPEEEDEDVLDEPPITIKPPAPAEVVVGTTPTDAVSTEHVCTMELCSSGDAVGVGAPHPITASPPAQTRAPEESRVQTTEPRLPIELNDAGNTVSAASIDLDDVRQYLAADATDTAAEGLAEPRARPIAVEELGSLLQTSDEEEEASNNEPIVQTKDDEGVATLSNPSDELDCVTPELCAADAEVPSEDLLSPSAIEKRPSNSEPQLDESVGVEEQILRESPTDEETPGGVLENFSLPEPAISDVQCDTVKVEESHVTPAPEQETRPQRRRVVRRQATGDETSFRMALPDAAADPPQRRRGRKKNATPDEEGETELSPNSRLRTRGGLIRQATGDEASWEPPVHVKETPALVDDDVQDAPTRRPQRGVRRQATGDSDSFAAAMPSGGRRRGRRKNSSDASDTSQSSNLEEGSTSGADVETARPRRRGVQRQATGDESSFAAAMLSDKPKPRRGRRKPGGFSSETRESLDQPDSAGAMKDAPFAVSLDETQGEPPLRDSKTDDVEHQSVSTSSDLRKRNLETVLGNTDSVGNSHTIESTAGSVKSASMLSAEQACTKQYEPEPTDEETSLNNADVVETAGDSPSDPLVLDENVCGHDTTTSSRAIVNRGEGSDSVCDEEIVEEKSAKPSKSPSLGFEDRISESQSKGCASREAPIVASAPASLKSLTPFPVGLGVGSESLGIREAVQCTDPLGTDYSGKQNEGEELTVSSSFSGKTEEMTLKKVDLMAKVSTEQSCETEASLDPVISIAKEGSACGSVAKVDVDSSVDSPCGDEGHGDLDQQDETGVAPGESHPDFQQQEVGVGTTTVYREDDAQKSESRKSLGCFDIVDPSTELAVSAIGNVGGLASSRSEAKNKEEFNDATGYLGVSNREESTTSELELDVHNRIEGENVGIVCRVDKTEHAHETPECSTKETSPSCTKSMVDTDSEANEPGGSVEDEPLEGHGHGDSVSSEIGLKASFLSGRDYSDKDATETASEVIAGDTLGLTVVEDGGITTVETMVLTGTSSSEARSHTSVLVDDVDRTSTEEAMLPPDATGHAPSESATEHPMIQVDSDGDKEPVADISTSTATVVDAVVSESGQVEVTVVDDNTTPIDTNQATAVSCASVTSNSIRATHEGYSDSSARTIDVGMEGGDDASDPESVTNGETSVQEAPPLLSNPDSLAPTETSQAGNVRCEVDSSAEKLESLESGGSGLCPVFDLGSTGNLDTSTVVNSVGSSEVVPTAEKTENESTEHEICAHDKGIDPNALVGHEERIEEAAGVTAASFENESNDRECSLLDETAKPNKMVSPEGSFSTGQSKEDDNPGVSTTEHESIGSDCYISNESAEKSKSRSHQEPSFSEQSNVDVAATESESREPLSVQDELVESNVMASYEEALSSGGSTEDNLADVTTDNEVIERELCVLDKPSDQTERSVHEEPSSSEQSNEQHDVTVATTASESNERESVSDDQAEPEVNEEAAPSVRNSEENENIGTATTDSDSVDRENFVPNKSAKQAEGFSHEEPSSPERFIEDADGAVASPDRESSEPVSVSDALAESKATVSDEEPSSSGPFNDEENLADDGTIDGESGEQESKVEQNRMMGRIEPPSYQQYNIQGDNLATVTAEDDCNEQESYEATDRVPTTSQEEKLSFSVPTNEKEKCCVGGAIENASASDRETCVADVAGELHEMVGQEAPPSSIAGAMTENEYSAREFPEEAPPETYASAVRNEGIAIEEPSSSEQTKAVVKSMRCVQVERTASFGPDLQCSPERSDDAAVGVVTANEEKSHEQSCVTDEVVEQTVAVGHDEPLPSEQTNEEDTVPVAKTETESSGQESCLRDEPSDPRETFDHKETSPSNEEEEDEVAVAKIESASSERESFSPNMQADSNESIGHEKESCVANETTEQNEPVGRYHKRERCIANEPIEQNLSIGEAESSVPEKTDAGENIVVSKAEIKDSGTASICAGGSQLPEMPSSFRGVEASGTAQQRSESTNEIVDNVGDGSVIGAQEAIELTMKECCGSVTAEDAPETLATTPHHVIERDDASVVEELLAVSAFAAGGSTRSVDGADLGNGNVDIPVEQDGEKDKSVADSPAPSTPEQVTLSSEPRIPTFDSKKSPQASDVTQSSKEAAVVEHGGVWKTETIDLDAFDVSVESEAGPAVVVSSQSSTVPIGESIEIPVASRGVASSHRAVISVLRTKTTPPSTSTQVASRSDSYRSVESIKETVEHSNNSASILEIDTDIVEAVYSPTTDSTNMDINELPSNDGEGGRAASLEAEELSMPTSNHRDQSPKIEPKQGVVRSPSSSSSSSSSRSKPIIAVPSAFARATRPYEVVSPSKDSPTKASPVELFKAKISAQSIGKLRTGKLPSPDTEARTTVNAASNFPDETSTFPNEHDEGMETKSATKTVGGRGRLAIPSVFGATATPPTGILSHPVARLPSKHPIVPPVDSSSEANRTPEVTSETPKQISEPKWKTTQKKKLVIPSVFNSERCDDKSNDFDGEDDTKAKTHAVGKLKCASAPVKAWQNKITPSAKQPNAVEEQITAVSVASEDHTIPVSTPKKGNECEIAGEITEDNTSSSAADRGLSHKKVPALSSSPVKLWKNKFDSGAASGVQRITQSSDTTKSADSANDCIGDERDAAENTTVHHMSSTKELDGSAKIPLSNPHPISPVKRWQNRFKSQTVQGSQLPDTNQASSFNSETEKNKNDEGKVTSKPVASQENQSSKEEQVIKSNVAPIAMRNLKAGKKKKLVIPAIFGGASKADDEDGVPPSDVEQGETKSLAVAKGGLMKSDSSRSWRSNHSNSSSRSIGLARFSPQQSRKPVTTTPATSIPEPNTTDEGHGEVKQAAQSNWKTNNIFVKKAMDEPLKSSSHKPEEVVATTDVKDTTAHKSPFSKSRRPIWGKPAASTTTAKETPITSDKLGDTPTIPSISSPHKTSKAVDDQSLREDLPNDDKDKASQPETIATERPEKPKRKPRKLVIPAAFR